MVGEPIAVKVNQNTTVEQICNRISRVIGLRVNRDFRLFHEIGKKELRVLDHGQRLMEIFKLNSKGGSLLRSIKLSLIGQAPNLIFKKYYCLPPDLELSESRKDLTRLRLMVYQVFAEVKDMKYYLKFEEYLLFLGMLIFIESRKGVSWNEEQKESEKYSFEGEHNLEPTLEPQAFKASDIHRIIPQTIFKLKNFSEEQWVEAANPYLVRLGQEIEGVISTNKRKQKAGTLKVDSALRHTLYFSAPHLCMQLLLNTIRRNPLSGSNIFYVQPYNKTYNQLYAQGKKVAYNMWLAIKVESLTLLTPTSKESVLELHYSDIDRIKVYSEAVVFKMNDIEGLEYRLDTYQSFEISQLVKYNQALNYVLNTIETDADLLYKTNVYK